MIIHFSYVIGNVIIYYLLHYLLPSKQKKVINVTSIKSNNLLHTHHDTDKSSKFNASY